MAAPSTSNHTITLQQFHELARQNQKPNFEERVEWEANQIRRQIDLDNIQHTTCWHWTRFADRQSFKDFKELAENVIAAVGDHIVTPNKTVTWTVHIISVPMPKGIIPELEKAIEEIAENRLLDASPNPDTPDEGEVIPLIYTFKDLWAQLNQAAQPEEGKSKAKNS